MARDYVRDKEAVQDLNKELIKGEEFINKQKIKKHLIIL